MASRNRNYEIQRKLQLFIELFVIFLNNLKIIDHRKSNVFYLMYKFFCFFGAPWTLPPRVGTLFILPPSPSYAPAVQM
jgi:hypothetical protein